MEQMRLNKYLAKCGICSRRDADKLIEQGSVTVNGVTAMTGMQVSDADQVLVNGKAVQAQSKNVVLAFYKPVGVVCTERDPHAEKIINDLVKYPVRLTYAGRLDKESEGLLLLTNDGNLIDAMMRGANRHEKEYLVKVENEITPVFLRKMSDGVFLPELDLTTRKCEVEQVGKFTFRIVLTQGVNRQIRRMCKECGYRVKSLKRVRVMNISLDGLHPGQWRELSEAEQTALYRDCKMLNVD